MAVLIFETGPIRFNYGNAEEDWVEHAKEHRHLCLHLDEDQPSHPPHEPYERQYPHCSSIPQSYEEIIDQMFETQQQTNIQITTAGLISRYIRHELTTSIRILDQIQSRLDEVNPRDPGGSWPKRLLDTKDEELHQIVRVHTFCLRRLQKGLQRFITSPALSPSPQPLQDTQNQIRHLLEGFDEVLSEVKIRYDNTVRKAALQESKKSIEMAEKSIQESERVKIRKCNPRPESWDYHTR